VPNAFSDLVDAKRILREVRGGRMRARHKADPPRNVPREGDNFPAPTVVLSPPPILAKQIKLMRFFGAHENLVTLVDMVSEEGKSQPWFKGRRWWHGA
jgi:hypothetical protein